MAKLAPDRLWRIVVWGAFGTTTFAQQLVLLHVQQETNHLGLLRSAESRAWRVFARLILFPKASLAARHLQDCKEYATYSLTCYKYGPTVFLLGTILSDHLLVLYGGSGCPRQLNKRDHSCQAFAKLLLYKICVKSIENLTNPESSVEMQFQISTVVKPFTWINHS